MRLNAFNEDLHKRMLDLIWRQWTALGVHGYGGRGELPQIVNVIPTSVDGGIQLEMNLVVAADEMNGEPIAVGL